MGKKLTQFEQSAYLNNRSYLYYLERLTELSVSMFEWEGLPDTVDARYIEMQLFETGAVVYFNDEIIGNLCLTCIPQGRLDVYGVPILRRAYSMYNNYSRTLSGKDSVIVYNNYLRINSVETVTMFARKLYLIDRIIDVNMHAQRTPVLIQGTEKQRLSLLNLYKEYEGNVPVIFGDKSLDLQSLKVLKTDAPYIIDKLQNYKSQVWNEALTYLGISNLNVQKRERLITDEVTRSQGGTIANRYSRLNARREGAERINRMFGTDIEVNYREDFQMTDEITNDTTGGMEDE